MALAAALAATLSANESERHAAEQELKNMEGSPGYLVQLFGLVVSNDVSIHIRQAGTIYFKNVISREWEEELEDGKAPKLSDADKQAVRDNILEALIYAHPLVRVQVAVALRTIANADFPERWPSLVPGILQNIHSNDPQRCYGALLALRVLAKKYEYKPSEQRGPVEELVNVTFPVLLQLFQYLRTLQTVEAAEMQKLICKIYWSCTQLVVPLYMLQPAHVDAWMTCLLSLFEQPVPTQGMPQDVAELPNWPWWKCKKWIGHIFDRIFTRFGNPKLVSQKVDRAQALKEFSVYFTGHWAGRILQACLQMASGLQNGVYVPPRVLNLALSYIETSVGSSAMYKLLKPHLEGILFQVVFPLLCYDSADETLWREDPAEYVRKQYDVLEDFYSPRTAAVNLLLKLARSRAKDCLDPLCTFLVNTLTRYNATPQEQRNGREKYGALSCIGALYDKLKTKKTYQGWLEPMLMMHVLPEFDSPNGLLRAKACWVVGQYADLEFSVDTNFARTIDCVLSRLQDAELPVRVEAAVALKALVENEKTVEHLKPALPHVLDMLFKLMDDIDNEDLVSTLEVFIEQYGDAMAPYAVQVVGRLAEAFLRMASADEEDEESGLAAMGCMRAINLTMQSVHARPDLYPAMEAAMLPLIAHMLKPAGVEYFEEVLESISYLTYFSPKISPGLWQVFGMICAAFHEWGWDYLSNLVPPIDNFISRDPDSFVSPQNNYIAMIFDLCKKVMERDDGGETECREACKLVESVLHNCKGKIDAWVPQFVQICVARLQTARSVALKVLLLEQISNALYYNPVICLSALESLGCTSEVFYAWFQLLDKFVRLHDKKIAIIGLVTLLKIPASQLPAAVQAGHKHIFEAVIKLSEAIVKQRDDHQKAAEEEGGEEHDGSDPDEEDWNSDKELDDDEDEVSEKDEAYLRMLEERAKAYAEGGDDGDELDEEDDVDYSTPIDDVDELVYFADTLQELQATGVLATTSFTPEEQARIQHLLNKAQERREEKEKEKRESGAPTA
eukprot:tig00000217_g19147.t1